MKDQSIYYQVGPLLYCPANRKSIVSSLSEEKFGTGFSLALCLEDSINDAFVSQAETDLVCSLNELLALCEKKAFSLPKIFIRVRNQEQIMRLALALKEALCLVKGFILPKFSPENADGYLEEMIRVNEFSSDKLFMMPIYESSSIIHPGKRIEILSSLKDSLASAEDLVLNIRVGGNDLCHALGFRRKSTESIHRITPISSVFSDIVSIYGTDYVISGPVWEYYAGDNWKEGLEAEIDDDKLCGFIGKTVIHPNQIAVVRECYKVSESDYRDALSILNWSPASELSVSSSVDNSRMNEYKTHTNWAKKILFLAEAYGIAGQ